MTPSLYTPIEEYKEKAKYDCIFLKVSLRKCEFCKQQISA
ncbi:hypothetical protein HMPREF1869_00878 [Bacteroidales bacterium KA00251]|nr:hypothetical protein HMPREF1869_00878 [Bacteroidales bacterium KA00251]